MHTDRIRPIDPFSQESQRIRGMSLPVLDPFKDQIVLIVSCKHGNLKGKTMHRFRIAELGVEMQSRSESSWFLSFFTQKFVEKP